MARLEDLVESEQAHLRSLPLPRFELTPWTTPPSREQRRVAIVTTAGLMRRTDEAFAPGAGDYRVLPADLPAAELMMSHISVNFDRTGFQDDVNVVYPIDRLKDLAAAGDIASVASYHYSFMGATDPAAFADTARGLAGLLKEDAVNVVLLSPV